MLTTRKMGISLGFRITATPGVGVGVGARSRTEDLEERGPQAKDQRRQVEVAHCVRLAERGNALNVPDREEGPKPNSVTNARATSDPRCELARRMLRD